MRARNDILGRLRAGARPVELPEPWAPEKREIELVEQFTRALQDAHGEVFQESTLEMARKRLEFVQKENRVRSAIWNFEPPLDGLDLPTQFGKVEWMRPPVGPEGGPVIPEERDPWRNFAAGADLGVTGAEVLLAQTGSVGIATGASRSRLVSLLPPIHVVLASVSLLAPDIFSWMESRAAAGPSNFVLISGPSKTGDIEQTLAVGVHGPKRLIVILYHED